MYSIYLETVQRGSEGKEQVKGKPMDLTMIQVSERLPCQLDKPILRRITPGSSRCSISTHPPSLTKRDSTYTADTALLSDDDKDEEDDQEDHTVAGCVIDNNNENGNSDGRPLLDDSAKGSRVLVMNPSKCHPAVNMRNVMGKDESSLSFSDSDEDISLEAIPGGGGVGVENVLPDFRFDVQGSEGNRKATIESHDCITSTHCTCCEKVLFCGHNVTHVLCSDCQVVSQVYTVEARRRPTVGVGWTEEEFSNHLNQQQFSTLSESSSSLAMPPLI